MNNRMKEYKIEIGKVKANISNMVILKIELPIDRFSYDEVNEIVNILQNKKTVILDFESNEYKVIDETLCVGRNAPTHTNDYERFLGFDVAYISKDKMIKDISAWLERLSKSNLTINLQLK